MESLGLDEHDGAFGFVLGQTRVIGDFRNRSNFDIFFPPVTSQVTLYTCVVWYNVYPKYPKNFLQQVKKVYNDCKKLQSTLKSKMMSQWEKEKVGPYLKTHEDPGRRLPKEGNWNYAAEFDFVISPINYPAKIPQKERFSSPISTVLVTLFLDKQVSSFLGQFTNITNRLACIKYSFESLECLSVSC